MKNNQIVFKLFPYNKAIISAEYNNEHSELTIDYRTKTGRRTYQEVPNEIFYKLYYMYDATLMLEFYANNIKKKFKVKPLIK